MISQQVLTGNWHEIRGKLRSKWGALTDDDLAVVGGNVEELVGAIQRRTGEARESIERYMESVSKDGVAAMSRAGQAVRTGAEQAVEAVEETSLQAADAVRCGYREVEEMVRGRPAEALAVCFAVGVATGVAAVMLLRGR